MMKLSKLHSEALASTAALVPSLAKTRSSYVLNDVGEIEFWAGNGTASEVRKEHENTDKYRLASLQERYLRIQSIPGVLEDEVQADFDSILADSRALYLNSKGQGVLKLNGQVDRDFLDAQCWKSADAAEEKFLTDLLDEATDSHQARVVEAKLNDYEAPEFDGAEYNRENLREVYGPEIEVLRKVKYASRRQSLLKKAYAVESKAREAADAQLAIIAHTLAESMRDEANEIQCRWRKIGSIEGTKMPAEAKAEVKALNAGAAELSAVA